MDERVPANLSRTQSNSYSTLAERFTQRLASAVRKESWGRTVLKLAWTAGPVTYLALQGGYYVGLGQTAPSSLFIYFAMYTAIAGFIAVGTRFIYNAIRGHEQEEAARSLTDVMDKLPDFLVAVRNISLESYDENNRAVLAAKYVLENPDASESAVQSVLEDLTGDFELARALGNVEVFRRSGLNVRIRDLYSSVSESLATYLPEIALKSRTVAQLVKERFIGIVPDKRDGRSRTEGFIERIFAAGEEDNFSLMAITDVEEMLVFAFELLAGRRFPLLSVEYSGTRAFTEIAGRLDRSRRELRAIIHSRNSRLRMLAEYLNEAEAIERVVAAIPALASVSEVHDNIRTALYYIYDDLSRRLSAASGIRPRDRIELVGEVRSFHTAVSIYDRLYRANMAVRRRHLEFRRALKEYETVRGENAGIFALRLLRPGERGNGIRIRRRSIGLSEKDRLWLARHLSAVFAHISVQSRFHRAVISEAGSERRYLSPDGYKEIAFEVAMLLDRKLDIARPEVQYAVEGTNSAALNSLEVGLTQSVKAGWAVSLVQEVRDTSRKAIHRLARGLVQYHGVSLSPESIRFLAEEFDASEEELSELTPPEDEEGVRSMSNLVHQLLDIPLLPREFASLAERSARQFRTRPDIGPDYRWDNPSLR